MPDELLVRFCAPTLASLKTGSLFSCEDHTRDALLDWLRSLNRRLGDKGLRVLPLRYRQGRCLVYVYRPSLLRRDLAEEGAVRILRACGYPCGADARCLLHLMALLRGGGPFPHEIGLFLGYPPEDVDGFMHRRGEATLTGCWRVYGDPERARQRFDRYQRCTRLYLEQFSRGRDIVQLTVPR